MSTSEDHEYYGVLGVATAATEDEIRHAYRQQAKRWHPDRFRDATAEQREEAEQRMRLLTEAHSVLGDPEKRADYDHQREHSPAHPYPHTHYAHGAASSGQGQPVDGVPFYGNAPTWGVPGYQSSYYTQASTSETNPAFFIGVICLIIALVALANVRRVDNGLPLIMVLGIAFGAGFLAITCFMNADRVVRVLSHAAQRTPPTGHQRPNHVPEQELTPFEALVQRTLWNLPQEFADKLENVTVLVEDEPSAEVLRRVGVKPGAILLGLYQGVPTTQQHVDQQGLPETITLYQGPIERYCLFSPPRIEHQIEATLLHEIAHHFGIDHDEMPIWVKA